MNKGLERAEDLKAGLSLFESAVGGLNRRIDEEKQQHLQQPSATSASSASSKKKAVGAWSPEELNLLIKAVNLFPAGTNQRYLFFFLKLLLAFTWE